MHKYILIQNLIKLGNYVQKTTENPKASLYNCAGSDTGVTSWHYKVLFELFSFQKMDFKGIHSVLIWNIEFIEK